MPEKNSYKEIFLIRLNDRIIPLQTTEAAYIYSEDKSNYLMTFDQRKYIIDFTLDAAADSLDPAVFFRISRKCLISIKAISAIIRLPSGRLRIFANPEPSFEMTVSRSRVDDFLKWLER